MSGKRKYDHITPTLKQLKLLPISKLLYLRDAVLMFKCMKGLAPEYLSSMFMLRSDIHNRCTRNSDKLQIPMYRTKLAQQLFSYGAVDIWNSICKGIVKKNSVKLFKNTLKSSLN